MTLCDPVNEIWAKTQLALLQRHLVVNMCHLLLMSKTSCVWCVVQVWLCYHVDLWRYWLRSKNRLKSLHTYSRVTSKRLHKSKIRFSNFLRPLTSMMYTKFAVIWINAPGQVNFCRFHVWAKMPASGRGHMEIGDIHLMQLIPRNKHMKEFFTYLLMFQRYDCKRTWGCYSAT